MLGCVITLLVGAVSYSYTYDMPVFQRRRRVEATPTPQTSTEAEDLANIDTVLDGDSDSLKRDLRIHFEEYKEGHPTAL
jgi:hypothetical protein